MQYGFGNSLPVSSGIDSIFNIRRVNKTRHIVIHAFIRETYEIFLFLSAISLLYFILSGYDGGNTMVIANALRLIFTIGCYLVSHRMREGDLSLLLLWLVLLMNICIIPIFSTDIFYFRMLDTLSYFFLFWFTGFHPIFIFINAIIGLGSLTWANFRMLSAVDINLYEKNILQALSFTLLFTRLSVGLIILSNIYTNCSIVRDIIVNKINSIYDINVIIENESELIRLSKSLGISLKQLSRQSECGNNTELIKVDTDNNSSSMSLVNLSSIHSTNISRALSFDDNSSDSSSLGSSISMDTPVQSIGGLEAIPHSSTLQGLYTKLLVKKKNEVFERFSPSMTLIDKYRHCTKRLFKNLMYKFESFILTIRFAEFPDSTLPISTRAVSQVFLDQEIEGMYTQWLQFYSCNTIEQSLYYILLSCIIVPLMSTTEWLLLFSNKSKKLLCIYSPYVCLIQTSNKRKLVFFVFREGIQVIISMVLVGMIYILCKLNKIYLEKRRDRSNSQDVFEKRRSIKERVINAFSRKVMSCPRFTESIHSYIQWLSIIVGSWTILCNIVDCILMGNISLRFLTLSSSLLISGTYLNLRVSSTIIVYLIWGTLSFVFTVVISGSIEKYIPCIISISIPAASIIFLHTIPLDRVRRILFCRYVLPYILYIQHNIFVLKDSGEDIRKKLSNRYLSSNTGTKGVANRK
ncbi:putative membrane-associated protein [Cryptosporidium canis]|uniref:Membrane-associated protein n=1 Tax=Cryptosporidium canis TaxID=195482 RepID=A0A9D5DJ73_9CRYT|nr:putative membrane-associated protein [Cryptosporidium canis]